MFVLKYILDQFYSNNFLSDSILRFNNLSESALPQLINDLILGSDLIPMIYLVCLALLVHVF